MPARIAPLLLGPDIDEHPLVEGRKIVLLLPIDQFQTGAKRTLGVPDIFAEDGAAFKLLSALGAAEAVDAGKLSEP